METYRKTAIFRGNLFPSPIICYMISIHKYQKNFVWPRWLFITILCVVIGRNRTIAKPTIASVVFILFPTQSLEYSAGVLQYIRHIESSLFYSPKPAFLDPM